MVINPRFPKELIFFSDVKDAVADAATRIFLTGNEICHDTLVECLADHLTFAKIIEDNYTAGVMQHAIDLLEENRGHLLTARDEQNVILIHRLIPRASLAGVCPAAIHFGYRPGRRRLPPHFKPHSVIHRFTE